MSKGAHVHGVSRGKHKIARRMMQGQRAHRPTKQHKRQDPRLCLLDTAVVAPTINGRDPLILRPVMEAVWKQRVNAKRYLFDREASARVGEMMHSHIDLMIDNIEFARQPFPTTYFEIDALAMWREWRPGQPIMATADERVGYLIHEGTVMILTAGKRPETSRAPEYPGDYVGGIAFAINRPQSIPMTKLTTTTDEAQADLVKQAYVFGGQRRINTDDPRVRTTPDGRRYIDKGVMAGRFDSGVDLPALDSAWTHSQIAAHFDIVPAFTELLHKSKLFTELCFLAGGDPMIVTTMLLLLNQPSKYVSMEPVGREVGLWRGERKVFREHHIVRIKLDRAVKVRDIFNMTDRRSPARHEVSGHWKHYNKSQGCNHHHPDLRQAWEPVGADRTDAGDYKRYWCPYCLQRRTWTEHFTAGGPGVTTTEYAVSR